MKTSALILAALSFALPVNQARASGTETFVGIGVTISSKDKAFQITDMIAEAPAAQAGVVVGEWITAVDQKATDGLKLGAVVDLIAGGAQGTNVVLTLKAKEGDSTRDVTITRGLVTIQCLLKGSVHLSLMGDLQSGSLTGWIGDDHVFLNVFNGRAQGMIDREYVYLNLDNRFGNDLEVSGWVRSNFVRWQGFGTFVTGHQACIY